MEDRRRRPARFASPAGRRGVGGARDGSWDQPPRFPQRGSARSRRARGAPGSRRVERARTAIPERPLPTGAHRPPRQPSGEFRDRASPRRHGAGRKIVGRRRGDRRWTVRSGCRRRRHQRPRRGLAIPKGDRPRDPDSHSRQSRRFRGPRETERVHSRGSHGHRLRRHAVAGFTGDVQRRGARGAPRSERGDRRVLHRVRSRLLPLPEPRARRVLRLGGLRRGPAGERVRFSPGDRLRLGDAHVPEGTSRFRPALRESSRSVGRRSRRRRSWIGSPPRATPTSSRRSGWATRCGRSSGSAPTGSTRWAPTASRRSTCGRWATPASTTWGCPRATTPGSASPRNPTRLRSRTYSISPTATRRSRGSSCDA